MTTISLQKNTMVRKGFTLVELLIAIAILSISILATFTAVSNNLKGTNFSQDQVQAYYLADESIEFIRNIRDENGIKNIVAFGNGSSAVSWLQGVAAIASDPCSTGKTCIIDSSTKTITACAGGALTCSVIKIDPVTGLFGYTSSWIDTRFRRSISVTVVSSTEALITVTVSWSTNGIPKDYVESETIESWQ